MQFNNTVQCLFKVGCKTFQYFFKLKLYLSTQLAQYCTFNVYCTYSILFMQCRCLDGFLTTRKINGWKSTIVTEVRQKFNGGAGACATRSLQESSAFDSSAIASANQPLRLLFEVAAVARRSVVMLSLPVASQASAQMGHKMQIKMDRMAWLLTVPASFVSWIRAFSRELFSCQIGLQC